MFLDKINVNKGLPQKYGTQCGPNGIFELENKDSVNVYRVRMGLQPLNISND